MPRKYEKKTKGNFRSGRRGSRRVSMRLNMISPGFSMFSDEFDPSVDDTMLFLKAKGMDRERERFGEALGEVRDRISRIVDDYDAMLEETAYIYRDYIDELEEQALVIPGSKLRQNILRILSDYKLVCEEREELLNQLHESLSAQKNSMSEAESYFNNDEEEFDFFSVDNSLRNYTKTVHWLSDKFKDMDAKVHMLKKRDSNPKGEKRGAGSKQGKHRKSIKISDNNKDKPDAVTSKERLETWKFAADEIVGLLKTVRQEGEGDREALEFELQKIMNIMNKQNEEIEKKKELLEKEKETSVKFKQSLDKMQIQNTSLENKLQYKRNEVTKCKQYIEDIVKKLKETKGEIKFSLEDMGNDFQEELSTVMRRRFTLTESAMAGDITQLQLKDARRRTTELEDEKLKMEEDMAKLSNALVQKEHEFAELRTLLTGGDETLCSKCIGLASTPASEDEGNSPNKLDEVELLEKMLKESESKLESTVVELARMKIKMASSGETVISYVDVAIQTAPKLKDKDQRSLSNIGIVSQFTEDGLVIQSTSLKTEDIDQRNETNRFSSSISFISTKDKKRTGIEDTIYSNRQQGFSSQSPAEDDGLDDDGNYKGDELYDKYHEDQMAASRLASSRNIKVENKAVQTVREERGYEENSLLTRAPLQLNVSSSELDDNIDGGKRLVDDIKQTEIDMLADGENKLGVSWREKLQRLSVDIGNALEDGIKSIYYGNDNFGETHILSSDPGTTVQQNDVADLFDEFGSHDEQYAQKQRDVKKRKSIFMRLVENNNCTRARSFKTGYNSPRWGKSTPQNLKNVEDPNSTLSIPHLPALTPSLTANHALAPTLQKSKPAMPPLPKRISNLPPLTPQAQSQSSTHQMVTPDKTTELPKDGTEILDESTTEARNQETALTSKQSVITPHTPRGGIHAFTFPGKDAMTKSEMQPGTVEDDVIAPYSKPFRVRRKSIFGHTDIMEKLAAGITGAGDTEISGERRLVDDVMPHDIREYEGDPEEYFKALSAARKNQGRRFSEKEASILNQDLDEQQNMKYRPRTDRGRYRPSVHPFIGMSPEARLAGANARRSNISDILKPAKDKMAYDDEELEIEVGSLMNNLQINSLRKTFLRLGLMHLKGDGDDIRPEERLTMEDQVNIIAQVAMDALKTTCDIFAQHQRQDERLSRLPLEQSAENSDETNQPLEMLPPVNSPEFRTPVKDIRKESIDDKDKEISLPGLAEPKESPKTEVCSVTTKSMRRKTKPRNERESRSNDLFSRYAKRRSLYRPFRNLNQHKTVVEKILGARMNVFGNLLGQDSRYGPARSYKNAPYLKRDTMDDGDGFSITAQAIKHPSNNAPRLSVGSTAFDMHTRSQLKPKQAGMPRSTSIDSHSHGLSLTRGFKYVPAITKAKSEQTHNRLFVSTGGSEARRGPLTKVRESGRRKTSSFE